MSLRRAWSPNAARPKAPMRERLPAKRLQPFRPIAARRAGLHRRTEKQAPRPVVPAECGTEPGALGDEHGIGRASAQAEQGARLVFEDLRRNSPTRPAHAQERRRRSRWLAASAATHREGPILRTEADAPERGRCRHSRIREAEPARITCTHGTCPPRRPRARQAHRPSGQPASSRVRQDRRRWPCG